MNTASQFKTFTFFLCLICFSFTGCHFNSRNINSDEDKNDAEKITKEFYDLLKKADYVKTYKLFGKNFFVATDTSKLNDLFITTNEKLGPIESMELGEWETIVVTGTDAKSDYALQYIVKHEKFEAKETFRLTKENGQIKIVGYNVNSDGFFARDKK